MSKKSLKILITGGGSGIGAALAEALSEDLHKIIICGRRINKLEEVASKSENIQYHFCDVSDEQSVLSFLDFVKTKFDCVDVIINCAGTFGAIGRFDKTDSELWRKTFEINTFGPYLITKHFLYLLLKSETKKIINFSGGGAFNPFPNYSAYAVSKAGIVRLSENMAVELADLGVTVNCIAPGFVETELHKLTFDAGEELAGEYCRETEKKLEEGHTVPIETPVNCVRFLISEKSDGLTGKTISANFDRWDTDTFKESIKDVNSSDVYTLRRINLINLEDKDNTLKERLMKVQKR